MSNITERSFYIKKDDFYKSTKIFFVAIGIAFIITFALYLTISIFTEPTSVDSAVKTTTSAATKKVEVANNNMSIQWSIFLSNTIAILTVTFGTPLILFIHNIIINELKIRDEHSFYRNISLKLESILIPVVAIINHISRRKDPVLQNDKKLNENKIQTTSIWNYSIFSRYDYRTLSKMIPFLIPMLTLIVNGMITGFLMAFNVYNGMISGVNAFGTSGIIYGIIFSLSFFVSSILPHAIIEIPALIYAVAISYRFAKIQSSTIYSNNLFLGDTFNDLKNDLNHINNITRTFLKTKNLWINITIILGILVIAAYIETEITPDIINTTINTVKQHHHLLH